MEQSAQYTNERVVGALSAIGSTTGSPGTSWGAIVAGAVVAAAVSLILLVLGTGLGLTSVSPWANEGVSATTFGIAAAVWLILMQLISAGLGGYVGGRLRTCWAGLHTDEVFFRDTAHGFVVWAVATLLTAGFLSSAAVSAVSGGVKAGAAVATGVAGAAAAGGASAATSDASSQGSAMNGGYFTDMLLRTDKPAAGDASAMRAETGRILTTSLTHGEVSPDDRAYLAQIVAARTGLSQADAEKRVNDTIAKAKATAAEAEQKAREAADEARKAAMGLSLWLFVSLLVGAFAASYAATIGGRQRDDVPAI